MKKNKWMNAVGGPNCGKTTLIKLLEKASVFVHGFIYADMSDDVIKFHRDPANSSPFKAAFDSVEHLRKIGKLLDDNLVFEAVLYYLDVKKAAIEKEDGHLRQVILSGFGRTFVQKDQALSQDPEARFFHISCTRAIANQNRLGRITRGEPRPDDLDEKVFNDRWDGFDNNGLKVIQACEAEYRALGRFNSVPFMNPLRSKALALMRAMDLTVEERNSIRGQLCNPHSKAGQYIIEIETGVKPAHPTRLAPPEGHDNARIVTAGFPGSKSSKADARMTA